MDDALRSDAVLAARLALGAKAPARSSVALSVANSCPPITRLRPATAEQQARADLQLQLAGEAQVAGDRRGIRDALRRAAELDPTNDAIARRVARASEELHDSKAAVSEYCRFLALAPRASDSAAALERLQLLSAYAVQSAPTQHEAAARNRTPVREIAQRQGGSQAREGGAPAGVRTVVSEAVASTPATVVADPESLTVVAHGGTSSPAADKSAADTAASRTEASQAGQAIPAQPAPERPAPTAKGAPTGVDARSVLTGAAVGAVIGTVVGRNARSAVIGAAAGGILGSIAGRPTAARRSSVRPLIYRPLAGRQLARWP